MDGDLVDDKLLSASWYCRPRLGTSLAIERCWPNQPIEHANVVATVYGLIVGCVTYDRTDEGVGDAGVFVAEGLDGTGVGDALLDWLAGVGGLGCLAVEVELHQHHQAVEPSAVQAGVGAGRKPALDAFEPRFEAASRERVDWS